MKTVKELLTPAARQYRHNSNNNFIKGYDVEETEKIVANLLKKLTAFISQQSYVQDDENCRLPIKLCTG